MIVAEPVEAVLAFVEAAAVAAAAVVAVTMIV